MTLSADELKERIGRVQARMDAAFNADWSYYAAGGMGDDLRSLIQAAELNAELVGALERLNALLDFDEPIRPGEMGIADPSAVSAAFDQARATLSKAKGGVS